MTRITTLLILLVASFAVAQTTDTQTPVFRSGVELARVDVRVVDANGRPVKDLRADEVAVTEAGERRPVVVFQHVAEPAGSYIEAARRTIGGEVSTNQGAPRGHLYVLVFDQQHITPGNEQRARLGAERFLRTRIRPGDRVALYAIPGPGPSLALSADVTRAIAELVTIRGSLDRTGFTSAGTISTFEAFQIARGNDVVMQRVATRSAETAGVDLQPTRTGQARAPSSGAGDSPMAVKQFILSSANTVVAQADADSRGFLSGLADVLRQLATFEGRKTVVLLSEGFYADNLSRDIEQVAAAAARAYATIYTLDLNRRGPDLTATEAAGAEPFVEIQSRLEPLGTLAADTDGQMMIDAGSQIDAAFDRVGDVSQDYYIVGFEPNTAALGDRDRYNRVRVTVTRAGITVHARTGYSLPDPAVLGDRRRAIDAALAAPFAQQGLPLAVTTYVMRGQATGVHRVIMSLEAEMPLRSAKGATAEVVFVAKNARDGRVVASGTDKMALPSEPTPGRTTGISRF